MEDPSDALEIDGDIQLSPTAITTAHLKTAGSLDIRCSNNLKIGTDGADSVKIGRTNTSAAKVHLRSGADTDLVVSGSKVGIGVDDPDVALEVFNTTTQLKLSYDASNQATQTVAADGELTLTTTGTDAGITLDPANQTISFGNGSDAAPVFNFQATGDGIIENRYKVGGASHFIVVVDETPDKVRFALGDGNQIVVTALANRLKVHDHATPTNPTLFVHSVIDPDTSNDQWVSLAHDQTNAVLGVGKGALSVGTSLLLQTAANGTTHGAGSASANPYMKVRKINDEIVTTVSVSLGAGAASQNMTNVGDDGDAIGYHDGSSGNGAAYIFGPFAKATHGLIYSVEMVCLQTPAGGGADIDLIGTTTATHVADDAVSGTAIVTAGGNHAQFAGPKNHGTNTLTGGLDGMYVYMTGGATGGGEAGAYTAGKFDIIFKGRVEMPHGGRTS